MTKQQFETAQFHKGQPAIFDGLLRVEIIGVDWEKNEIEVQTGTKDSEERSRRKVPFQFIELL